MKANTTPREIAERLAAQSESVCRWLLPAGKLIAGEWCCGSPAGEPGRSMKVRVTGDKAGIWADFASDGRGDLLDLIASVRGCHIRDAIKEAKSFLGIREPQNIVPERGWKSPSVKVAPAIEQGCPVLAYLSSDRGITADTAKLFMVGRLGREIVFPSYGPDGGLVAVKYLGLDRKDGRKSMRKESGCAPCLFGWQAAIPGCREVVITEGEIDAMTWRQMGYNALSLPNGVGDLTGWIEHDWEALQCFDTIYLAFDSDQPGRDAVEKVVKRLGMHRCRDVVMDGHKDANEALQAGKDASYFVAATDSAREFSPPEIVTPTSFAAGVMEEFFPSNGKPAGFWPQSLDGKVGFRAGEVTVWTGISGHGKSNLLLQVCMEAIACGQRSAIASMEMPGRKIAAQAVRLACPNAVKIQDITPEIVSNMLDLMAGKLWIFNVLGEVPLAKMLDLMEYAAARHSIDHFVIDSLMKLDVSSEDYDAQRKTLNRIVAFARHHDVHIHLVAHARKGEDEMKGPGKMDIKGSGDIGNQADNIVSVWRNKKKEGEVSENKLSDRQMAETPDAILYLVKDRENGDECAVRLWFQKRRKRFLTIGPSGLFNYPDLTPK